MKAVVLIGRILFSLIFLNTIFAHFSEQGVGYAASAGVPFPEILVPLSGIIAIAGAVSIILGFKARTGAWLLVLFLVPVTFMMHNFWALEGSEAQMQMVNFIKNLSLLGGALIIAYFGAGPLSIDNRSITTETPETENIRHKKFQPTFTREYKFDRPGIKSERTKDKSERKNQ